MPRAVLFMSGDNQDVGLVAEHVQADRDCSHGPGKSHRETQPHLKLLFLPLIASSVLPKMSPEGQIFTVRQKKDCAGIGIPKPVTCHPVVVLSWDPSQEWSG